MISELCGAVVVESVIAVIWSAEVEAVSVLVSGGANFDGICGILTRIARAIFEWFEENPLALFHFTITLLYSRKLFRMAKNFILCRFFKATWSTSVYMLGELCFALVPRTKFRNIAVANCNI